MHFLRIFIVVTILTIMPGKSNDNHNILINEVMTVKVYNDGKRFSIFFKASDKLIFHVPSDSLIVYSRKNGREILRP